MKKSIKFVTTIGIVLILTGTITLAILLGTGIPIQAIGTSLKYIFSSSTPDWKTYNSPNGEFSFESPFPIEWEMKGKIDRGAGQETIDGYSRLNKASFDLFVYFSHKTNQQTNCSFAENHLRLTKAFVEKQKDFTWKDQPITCSGIPSTIFDYSYQNGGSIEPHKDLVMTYDNHTLAIESYSFADKTDNYDEWIKRVINSIKITPHDP
jgi:hypothetical protein